LNWKGTLSFPIVFDQPLCTYFQCFWLSWKHKISSFSTGSTGRLAALEVLNMVDQAPVRLLSDRLTTPLWGLCNEERKRDFLELCKMPEHLISYAISTLIITAKPKAYNQ